jgi:hypothetical protein
MTNLFPQPPRDDLLSVEERGQVIAVLRNGSTRRIAARVVGCAPAVITRTAEHDPAFARDMARAEHSVEVDLLKSLRHASHDEKYWRAAAWTLERKNPEDFGLRRPSTVTVQAAQALFRQLMVSVRGILPAELRLLLFQRFGELIGRLDVPGKRQILIELAEDAAADQQASEEPTGEPQPQDPKDGP